jgi:nucleotide-binding universal stress UspA family protein
VNRALALADGDTERARPGVILVGIDGSPSARRALVWALEEGAVRGAVVEVLHAWQTPLMVLPVGMPVIAPGAEDQAIEAKELVEREIEQALSATTARPEVRCVAVEGGACSTLVDHAKGADLLVVGSHGSGALAELFLGSVSLHCVRHAGVPVVVVPSTGRHHWEDG